MNTEIKDKFVKKDQKTGETFGIHPKEFTAQDFNDLGHFDRPLSKVIRAKCLDCCVGNEQEVRQCVATTCDLYPYRMGSNPLRKKELSQEQKELITERFKKAREQKLSA